MESAIDIGIIELSEKVIVSDPCYERNDRGMVKDLTVKPGRYKTGIVYNDDEEWGCRIASLFAVHEDLKDPKLTDWKSVGVEVAVDSGQCGVFDDSIYPQLEDPAYTEMFYDENCSITLKKIPAGRLKNNKGAVSSSGYGDGVYELFAVYENGECVALMLDFQLVKISEIAEIISSALNTAADVSIV